MSTYEGVELNSTRDLFKEREIEKFKSSNKIEEYEVATEEASELAVKLNNLAFQLENISVGLLENVYDLKNNVNSFRIKRADELLDLIEAKKELLSAKEFNTGLEALLKAFNLNKKKKTSINKDELAKSMGLK